MPTPGADPPTKIFISYRHAGEDGFVGRLADRLAAVYGEANVFRDVAALRSGESFERRIGSRLDDATVVVAVIGSQWAGRRLLRGARIRDRSDWVRREIEHALASGKPVIPILVGNAALPDAADLPPSLRGLLAVHAGRVRDESFGQDLQRLVTEIDALAAGGGTAAADAGFAWRQVPVLEEPASRRWAFALAIAVVAAIWPAVMVLKPDRPAPTGASTPAPAPDAADPSTWALPPEAATRGPVSRIALQLALVELQTSTRESKGHNDGYNVGKFTARFGSQNLPWSAAFVGWCYGEAARRYWNTPQAGLRFTDSPSTTAVADSLQQKQWLVEPFDAARARPGDIVFLRVGERLGQMEIVYAVTPTTVCTIGGNVGNRVSGQCRPLAQGRVAALGVMPPEAFGPGA